jgi:hypothetical protein
MLVIVNRASSAWVVVRLANATSVKAVKITTVMDHLAGSDPTSGAPAVHSLCPSVIRAPVSCSELLIVAGQLHKSTQSKYRLTRRIFIFTVFQLHIVHFVKVNMKKRYIHIAAAPETGILRFVKV